MISPVLIPPSEARKIVLSAQRVLSAYPFGRSRAAVPKVIEHLGYVQIDTITVVERAHHHVLWSRLPSYHPEWLTLAQRPDRLTFEYWTHAAAYLPMHQYRYSIPVMDVFREQKDRWPKSTKEDMKKVIRRIKEEGPLMSRDFESSHKGGAWWDWKPAKWALQRSFFEGQLMISHREGFQRVYDLPERIIPPDIDTTRPTHKEYYAHHISTTLRAQGLASRKDLMHLRHIDHGLFDLVLRELAEDGSIVPVDTGSGKTYYTLPEYLSQRRRVSEKISLISPFDNLVIWRNRLTDLFDFDYTLECYLPEAKRTYGYFCLPVLYEDRFIGRVDVKADRKNKNLEVRKVYWEVGWEDMGQHPLWEKALLEFAAFNQCQDISFSASKGKM